MQPEQAYDLFLKQRDPIRDEDFFNDPAHGWLRDLWVAAHFGRAYGTFIGDCTLEFDWDRTHEWDFVLHIGSTVHPFQTTEALEPGRKRGLEYKQIERGERPRTTLESWEPGTRDGPKWIQAAIERKVNKNYAGVGALNLLVYANFPAYQLEFDRVAATVVEKARRFQSTWIITGKHLGMVHSSNETLGTIEPGWLVINQSPKS